MAAVSVKRSIRQQIDQKKNIQGQNDEIFTVSLNMTNHSFHLFVSFSIIGLKENVESLIYYSF